MRTELLVGAKGLGNLVHSTVMVVGIGGVGSYATEVLARSAIGKLILVDYDKVNISNINRQILALDSTVGQAKVEVMRQRIIDINPDCCVCVKNLFYEVGMGPELIGQDITYIVDAIDSLPAKVDLIAYAKQNDIPIISAMGTGNKLDPTKLIVADISKTHTCPMARVVRKMLRDRGIMAGVTTVFSTENPLPANITGVVGSIAFVPATAGLLLAAQVVRDIIADNEHN